MSGVELLTPCGCDDGAVGIGVDVPVAAPNGWLNSFCVEECPDCGATWSYIDWCAWVDAQEIALP